MFDQHPLPWQAVSEGSDRGMLVDANGTLITSEYDQNFDLSSFVAAAVNACGNIPVEDLQKLDVTALLNEAESAAERFIGNYVEAIENDDISYAMHNWITEPEHWDFDLAAAEALLRSTGKTAEEIEAFENDVRANLGDNNDNEYEDEDEEYADE